MTLNDLAAVPLFVWLIVAALFGLIFGSFITALSYRIPRGQSIADGRSQCPACQSPLTPRDLIPVLSWLSTGGTCRMCGVAISWRYPAIELLTALIFVSAAAHEQRLIPLGLLLLAAVLMMVLSIIDIEHRRLPLGLLGILGLCFLGLRWVQGGDGWGATLLLAAGFAVGGVAIAALSRAVLSAPLLGAGDAYGLALGALVLPGLSFAIFIGLAGLLGFAFGLLWRLTKAQALFPFAPALFSALWLTLLFGDSLIGFVS